MPPRSGSARARASLSCPGEAGSSKEAVPEPSLAATIPVPSPGLDDGAFGGDGGAISENPLFYLSLCTPAEWPHACVQRASRDGSCDRLENPPRLALFKRRPGEREKKEREQKVLRVVLLRVVGLPAFIFFSGRFFLRRSIAAPSLFSLFLALARWLRLWPLSLSLRHKQASPLPLVLIPKPKRTRALHGRNRFGFASKKKTSKEREEKDAALPSGRARDVPRVSPHRYAESGVKNEHRWKRK